MGAFADNLADDDLHGVCGFVAVDDINEYFELLRLAGVAVVFDGYLRAVESVGDSLERAQAVFDGSDLGVLP